MAITKTTVSDSTLLVAALEGLDLQKQRIDEQISQVKSMLGIRTPPPAAAAAPAGAVTKDESPKGRVLSAAARRRIAIAQKKRWAAYHKQKAAGNR